MNTEYKELIENILAEKNASQGLHLKEIANRIINSQSGGLFDENPLEFDEVYKKISALLSREVKKTTSDFTKVKNPKTKKDKKHKRLTEGEEKQKTSGFPITDFRNDRENYKGDPPITLRRNSG